MSKFANDEPSTTQLGVANKKGFSHYRIVSHCDLLAGLPKGNGDECRICQRVNCSPILNSGLMALGVSQLNRRRPITAPARSRHGMCRREAFTTPRRFSRRWQRRTKVNPEA